MHIVFTPDDGEKREWDFKLGRLLTTEVEAIEKRAGLQFAQLKMGVAMKDATTERALIWVLLKRAEPTLQFMDVDFPMDAFAADLDEEERAELRATIQRAAPSANDRRVALGQAGLLEAEDEPPAPKEEPAEEA